MRESVLSIFATLTWAVVLRGAPAKGKCTWENGCCPRHPRQAECRQKGRKGGGSANIEQPNTLSNDSANLRGFRSTSNFILSLHANTAARKTYIAHQQSKLSKAQQSDRLIKQIRSVDVGRQAQVTAQFEEAMRKHTAGIRSSIAGETILCIGARLGGEVRALKSLGALAIGIDLNPGPDSMVRAPEPSPPDSQVTASAICVPLQDVVVGDMEDIPFPSRTFGMVYSNVLDHVYNVAGLAAEVCRVLRGNGLFLAAVMGGGAADSYSPKQAIFESNRGALIGAVAAHGLKHETTTVTKHVIWNTGKTTEGTQRRPWHQKIITMYFRRQNASEDCS